MFWSESGEKSASDQAAFTRQNSSKLICGWILMWETTADALFHWRKSYYGLWTHIWVKNVLMDLSHLLSSPDVNWWTGVVWIIVMFLSDSHSDGTHSLQSIHCWDTDAVTHFYKPDEETNSSTSRMAFLVWFLYKYYKRSQHSVFRNTASIQRPWYSLNALC